MKDELELQPTGPVLIVGGYGTVGTVLARIAAPAWPLLLTGRNPDNGTNLARELGASLRRWDLSDPTPFSAQARAVISTVNDPQDRVLRAAAAAGIPYVDITRWTSRVARSATMSALLAPTAPIHLSSGWMGGVTNLVVAALANELGGAEAVDIAIRYDVNDAAGIDSVDFMDRLGQDYEVVENGSPKVVSPLTDVRWVDIAGSRTKVARIDTPEQLTLPLTLGAQTVTTRIGFSSNTSTATLLAAKRLGLFRWGRGDRWTTLRRSLLFSPGKGGSAQVRVEVTGTHGSSTAVIVDSAGQAHLTALGGFLGLQHVLSSEARPGVSFPESTPRPAQTIARLESLGVAVLRT